MKQRFRASRNIGVNHQFQIGQIDPPCRHVGRDTHPRAAIAHGLQGMGALVLAQFARKSDDRKAPIIEAAGHMIDGGAGRAKDQGILRLEKPQHINDRVFPVVGCDGERTIFDVEMLLLRRGCRNSHGTALVTLGQRLD